MRLILMLTFMLHDQTPFRQSKLQDRANLTLTHSLRDKISRRLHTRSRSLRCDLSCDPPLFRHRRRGSRYSSVFMSSAESSPLLNTPISCAEDIPRRMVRPDLARGVVNPLAAASLILATTGLDRLTSNVKGGSEMHPASQAHPEASRSGRSSGHVVPPNTPTITVCTPEGIPEASDEDMSSSNSVPVLGLTSYGIGSENLASESNLIPVDPVDQAFERARLTQDQPPKAAQISANPQSCKTPSLRVEFATPPDQWLEELETPRSPEEINSSLGVRPYLRTTASDPGLDDSHIGLVGSSGDSTSLPGGNISAKLFLHDNEGKSRGHRRTRSSVRERP